MRDASTPFTFRCVVFGCKWGSWKGSDDMIKGRKCHRCGRWEYEDGRYLAGVSNS